MTPPQPEPGDLLRAFLKNRSFPCPSCGFDLRDAPGDRCPECGTHLKLTLESATRNRGPLAVLLLLAGTTGATAVILASAAVQSAIYSLDRGRPMLQLDYDTEHIAIAVAGLPAGLSLLVWWLASPSLRESGTARTGMLFAAIAGAVSLILALALAG